MERQKREEIDNKMLKWMNFQSRKVVIIRKYMLARKKKV